MNDLRVYAQARAVPRAACAFAAAGREFTAAAQLKPQDGPTWNELGGVLYMANDYEGALTAFDRGRKLGENVAGNWFLTAIMLDKLHQTKSAPRFSPSCRAPT